MKSLFVFTQLVIVLLIAYMTDLLSRSPPLVDFRWISVYTEAIGMRCDCMVRKEEGLGGIAAY